MSTERSKTINSIQLERRKFTEEEDQILCNMVQKYGKKCWKFVAQHLTGKTPRQCRERYTHYLAPDIHHLPWTPQEDSMLIKEYSLIGPKWTKLKEQFQGRSTVNIKNRWTKLSRRANKYNLFVSKDGYSQNLFSESDLKQKKKENDEMNYLFAKLIPETINLFCNSKNSQGSFDEEGMAHLLYCNNW